MLDRYFTKHSNAVVIIIVLVSTILGFYLLGNNLKAQWSIIDDHEIMYFLGSDLKLQLTEIPKLILHTEVGSPGKSLRYRPIYYTLRIVEVFLWGANPALWYLSRIGMFIAVVAIFWWLSQKVVGFVGGFVFTLYLLTGRYWSDIWNRLGPQEAYAAFGMALYSLGFFSILSRKKVQNNKLSYIINLFLLTLGSLIALGSKENFLILVFPTIYLFIYKLKIERFDLAFVVATIINMIFVLFMLSSITLAILHSGHDVYKREINIISLLFAFLLLAFLIGFVTLGIYFLVKKSKLLSSYKHLILKDGFIVVSLFLLYLSQVVFYNTTLPINTRYDFPAMLVKPLTLLTGIYTVNRLLEIKGVKKKTVGRLNNFLFLGLAIIVILKGFTLREKSIMNARTTQLFTRRIQYLIKYVKREPDTPLVFETHSIWDYEPIFSVQRFLNTYNVVNPRYLRLHGFSINSGKNRLEKELSSQLYKISTGEASNNWGFQSLQKLQRKNKCFSVVFSGQQHDSCKLVVKIN